MNRKNGIVSLFWSSADKLLTNIITFVISIILARILNPDQYGVIATASIFIVLLSLFVEPGMTSALIQKKDSDKLDFSTILIFNIAVGICLYIVLFFLSDIIGEWFKLPVLSSVLKILGLQIILGGVNSVQIAYVQKNMMFKKYFICSLSSVIVSSIVGIYIAYQGAGVWALVVYNLLKQFINIFICYLLFKCRFCIKFSMIRFNSMFPFAGKMLFTKFIDQGYVEATQTIISKIYSSTDLAFYNKGKSFPDLIINNFNSALSSVIFPYFSILQDNIVELKSKIRIVVQLTSFFCMPMVMGLLACSENFVIAILTIKWKDSIPFLQLFCCYYIWVPFSNIIWQSLKAIGKSNIVLKLEVIKMLLNISLLILFLLLINSPISIVLSIVFSIAISFFIECCEAKKHLQYTIKEIICDFLPSFLIATIMAIIVFIIGKLNIMPIYLLLIQVAFGAVFYIFITWILKFSQWKLIRYYFKKNDK